MIDIIELKNISQQISDFKADKRVLVNSLSEEIKNRDQLEIDVADSLEARAIINTVVKSTQVLLESKFNSLVTLALQSVFQDDREFRIRFVEKRNKTEVECYFIKDGGEEDLYDGGGGPLDITSLACRFAFWNLDKTKRPIFFLDEPFKHLHSPTLQRNCSKMVQLISEKLGVQIIIVSDQIDIKGDIEYGVMKGEIYNVEELNEKCDCCNLAPNLFLYRKNGTDSFTRCKNCDNIEWV